MNTSAVLKPDVVSIPSKEFCDALERHGFNFLTGVPCSIFNPLYREIKNRPALPYLPAVREDSAVGIAVGAYLAGRKPVVIMQNSGLGYSLNAFTSLVMIYEIPFLVLISWRGYQGKDAPEHILMGAKMLGILDEVGLPYIVLGDQDCRVEMARASETLERVHKPVFVVVRNGVLA
ncbi:MAG: sulfopyruvate decarboxylase subunit alpha [Acidobacteriota bacterium]|nr:sulfopyruvate decarboxylase subunit alpha [Acidobacteriota bacterium]